MTAVPGRLLVVDDDVHIRRLIKVFLRDAQYELAEAATGEEALQLARRLATLSQAEERQPASARHHRQRG